MSAFVYVVCDGCNLRARPARRMSRHGASPLRADLARRDWGLTLGRDYCPECERKRRADLGRKKKKD